MNMVCECQPSTEFHGRVLASSVLENANWGTTPTCSSVDHERSEKGLGQWGCNIECPPFVNLGHALCNFVLSHFSGFDSWFEFSKRPLMTYVFLLTGSDI